MKQAGKHPVLSGLRQVLFGLATAVVTFGIGKIVLRGGPMWNSPVKERLTRAGRENYLKLYLIKEGIWMDLKKIFEERRSVNFFKPGQAITDDILKNVINLAALAPSAFNLQPWEIIAVRSAEAKEKLFPLASNQPKIKEAPVTLIIIGDLNGYKPENPAWNDLEAILNNKQALEKTQQYAAALYGSSELRQIKFAESNAALLAMSIMYAAKYYGLDTHPMSGIDFDGIKKEFGLGEHQTVVMLIALGYFDDSKTLYPRRKRKGYDDIVKAV